MTTRLQILGPYTPEHEGPFCTRDGERVELKIRNARGEYPVVGYVGDEESLSEWTDKGIYIGGKETNILNLMNAREAPVAREFWVNEYGPNSLSSPYETLKEAEDALGFSRGRTIHVREVLPGEGENTTQLRAEPNGGVSEALVFRSDALAKLAEKDAEIARLRKALDAAHELERMRSGKARVALQKASQKALKGPEA